MVNDKINNNNDVISKKIEDYDELKLKLNKLECEFDLISSEKKNLLNKNEEISQKFDDYVRINNEKLSENCNEISN